MKNISPHNPFSSWSRYGQTWRKVDLDELEELDGLDDHDLLSDSIVEITDNDGITYEYYELGTIEYQEKTYAFFTPAEEIEGIDAGAVVVYELDEISDELSIVEDNTLIDELMVEFYANYGGEYLEEDLDLEELN